MIHKSGRVPGSPATTSPPTNAQTNPVDGTAMVWVPASAFLMGSDDGSMNEKPQRTVYLDGYWIHTTLVTVAQYRLFCETIPRKMAPTPTGDRSS